MTTITKERIELFIKSPLENGLTRGEQMELARIALAALTAEPVAWTDELELKDVEKDGLGYLFTVNPITPNADPRRVIKLYAVPPAPVVPETLPCSVELKPGLIIGKGCKTETLLTALKRRADYYAELEALTPEQRAEHDAGIAEFIKSFGNSEQLNQAPVKQPSNAEQVADLYAPCWKPGDVVTYTLDPEKATIWLNNYSGTCVQEYVNLERLQEDTKHGLFEVAIARFSKMNEGFPIKRLKADWVISWMLENFPPVAQKQGDN
ncbi:hypothetical protein ACU6HL_004264 [Salmonella enterica]